MDYETFKEKFVKYDEGAAMFSMGIHSFMDLAKEAKHASHFFHTKEREKCKNLNK